MLEVPGRMGSEVGRINEIRNTWLRFEVIIYSGYVYNSGTRSWLLSRGALIKSRATLNRMTIVSRRRSSRLLNQQMPTTLY